MRHPVRGVVAEAAGERAVVAAVTVDEPGPGEVLVRTAACGLCHSDVHAITGDLVTPYPVVLGHEASGIVEAVGDGVTAFAAGDRVVACMSQFCGACPACSRGETWICERRDRPPLLRASDEPPRLRVGDTPAHAWLSIGGMAEWFLVHQQALTHIPDGMPLPQAALLGCAVLTGFGTVVNAARLRPGETLAVVGCGGVGLSAVQAAAIAGATRIVAIDRSRDALDLASDLGATDLVEAGEARETVARVRGLVPGGIDHAIEAVGLAETMETAIALIRPGGTAYIVGVARPDARISLKPLGLMWNHRTIRGIHMGENHFRRDIPRLAALYLAGRLDLDRFITRTLEADDVPGAFDAMRTGVAGRTVARFAEE